jgi:AcrR family transcriptional regulator
VARADQRDHRSLAAAVNEVRQRLPAARRRSQLLEVALERFAADGFHRTSMEHIADAAGVTKPVLYQHFGSKRTLYLELLESVGQELLDEVRDGVVAEEDPYQRVLAGFRAYFRFVCERTSAFQLLFGSGARSSDDFADAIRSIETSVAATVSAFIEADIDATYQELLGHAIVGLGEVAARFWVSRQEQSGHPDLDPAEGRLLAERLADLVWAGLRGLPGGATR